MMSMTVRRIGLFLILGLVVGMAAGCARTRTAESAATPAPALDPLLGAVEAAAPRSLATPGRIEPVIGRPYLAVDDPLMREMRHWIDSKDDAAGADLNAWLRRSGALALERQRLILLGLSDEDLVGFAATGAAATAPAGDRAEILRQIETRAETALNGEWQRAGSLHRAGDQRAYIAQMLEDARPSIKSRGRVRRELVSCAMAPFTYGWMGYHLLTTDRGPNQVQFERYTIYEPEPAAPQAEGAAREGQCDNAELIARYAPRIVQQLRPEASWEATSDVPGRVTLREGKRGQPEVEIDASRPTMYWYTTEAIVQGERLRQLVYAIWYPEHVAQKAMDPEAGKTEGLMLRVTLDRAGRPLVFETLSACGCHHQVFPTAALVRAAADEFGFDRGDAKGVIARISGKIDATVPESAGDYDAQDSHPTVWITAGAHAMLKVQAGPPAELKGAQRGAIALRDYAELEALPFGDPSHGRAASMFDRDGLVRGADRAEAVLLYSTGIFHAGTPRTRGTQLTHFDQHDFDDPYYLDTVLRWPKRPVESASRVAR